MTGPQRYRKKPVEIEAMQWTGDDDEVMAFMPVVWFVDKDIKIHTLEGVMVARPSDWIIRGIKGDFYPCRSDIFDATYEQA